MTEKNIFVEKLKTAHKKYPDVKAITFVGGVACNKFIRSKIETFCKNRTVKFFYPSPQFCTDNAAMVAFVANYRAQQHKFYGFNLDIL